MDGKDIQMTSEKELFEARLSDLCQRAQRYELCMSSFLTPRECFLAAQHMKQYAGDAFGVLYGGYDGCERARLLVLPDYLAEGNASWSAADVRERVPELAKEAVVALSVQGSGYRKLSHRDYLGALLALGLERTVIGDIAVRDEHSAIVFCDARIAPFLLSELSAVGSDKVKVERVALSPDFSIPREFDTISDTVASPRLDAVVATLARLSREGARQAIIKGLVEMDYEPCDKPDKTVPEGAVISIRGQGKFIVRSLSGLTKKGRYRFLADKYR